MAVKTEQYTTKDFLNDLGVLADEKMEKKRQALIASIDSQNEARKVKRAEKNAEADAPIAEGILDVVEGEMTAKQIADALATNGIAVSVPRVTAVAKVLVGKGDLKRVQKIGDAKNYYTK